MSTIFNLLTFISQNNLHKSKIVINFAVSKIKIYVFKAMSERKIVMYRSFQKALDAIRDLVTSYDNKVINKRFIDKAQAAIDSVVPHIRISFDTDFRGNRNNRFQLTFTDRYVQSVNGYLDYTQSTIYPFDMKEYINQDDFRMNSENCLYAFDKDNETTQNLINDLQNAIANAEDIYQKYEQLQKVIDDTLDGIPSCLRQRVYVNNPLRK